MPAQGRVLCAAAGGEKEDETPHLCSANPSEQREGGDGA